MTAPATSPARTTSMSPSATPAIRRALDDLPRPRAERRNGRDAEPPLPAERRWRSGPCFQDYPHIGGDANGIYITTNEYSLFGPGYNAAQIFAFSKSELAAHLAINQGNAGRESQLSTAPPGFTVWPATVARWALLERA